MWCCQENIVVTIVTRLDGKVVVLYLELLRWDAFAAVRTRLRSHWALHLLMLGQDEILDVLITLCALNLSVFAYW